MWLCTVLLLLLYSVQHITTQCTNTDSVQTETITNILQIYLTQSGTTITTNTVSEGTPITLYYQYAVFASGGPGGQFNCPPYDWYTTVTVSLSSIQTSIPGRTGAALILYDSGGNVQTSITLQYNSTTYNIPQSFSITIPHDNQYTSTRYINITNNQVSTAYQSNTQITQYPIMITDLDTDVLQIQPYSTAQAISCQTTVNSHNQVTSLILQQACLSYTFTVSLSSIPYNRVTITLSNTTEIGYNMSSIVFDSTNWNTLYSISINMLSLSYVNGTINTNAQSTLSIQSLDTYYNSTLLYSIPIQIIQNTFSYSSISPNFAAITCPTPICPPAQGCTFPNKTIDTLVTIQLSEGQTFDSSFINGDTQLPTVQCLFFDLSVLSTVSGVVAADASGSNQLVTGTIISPNQVQCAVPTCARDTAKIAQGDPQNCVSFDYTYDTTSLAGTPLTLIINNQLSINNQQFTYNMYSSSEYAAILSITPNQVDVSTATYITIAGVFFDYNFETGLTPDLRCLIDNIQSDDVFAINPSGITVPVQTPSASNHAIVCRVMPRLDLLGITDKHGVQVNVAFNGQDYTASDITLVNANIYYIDETAVADSAYNIIFYLSFNIVILIFIALLLQRWLCPMLCRKKMYVPEERKYRAVTGPQLLIEMLEPIVAKHEAQQAAEQAKLDAASNIITQQQQAEAKQREAEEQRVKLEAQQREKEQKRQLKASAKALQLEMKQKEKEAKKRLKREQRLRLLENPDFMTSDDVVAQMQQNHSTDDFNAVQPAEHDTAMTVDEQYDALRQRPRMSSIDKPVDDTGNRMSISLNGQISKTSDTSKTQKAHSKNHKSSSKKTSKRDAVPSKPDLRAAAAADAGVELPTTNATTEDKPKKSHSKKHKKASHKKTSSKKKDKSEAT